MAQHSTAQSNTAQPSQSQHSRAHHITSQQHRRVVRGDVLCFRVASIEHSRRTTAFFTFLHRCWTSRPMRWADQLRSFPLPELQRLIVAPQQSTDKRRGRRYGANTFHLYIQNRLSEKGVHGGAASYSRSSWML